MGILSAVYKSGLRVVNEVRNDIPTRMDNFGSYGRAERPGNSPGWSKPTRLEARKAYKTGDPDYNFADHMERGEAASASSTRAVRAHLAGHLKSKGIKHTQKTPTLKGEGKGASAVNTRIYSPRGGDLEPGHFGKTSTSKKELLARKRATLARNAGPKGGMR
jgi:hypothetical protein